MKLFYAQYSAKFSKAERIAEYWAIYSEVPYIYDNAFVSRNFGYASAVAMVLFALVLIVTLVQFRGEQKMAQ